MGCEDIGNALVANVVGAEKRATQGRLPMTEERDEAGRDGVDKEKMPAEKPGQEPSDAGTVLSPLVLAALGEMELPVEARVGAARITLGELLESGPGTVLKLDTPVSGPVDLLVGGQLVARGELVSIDTQLGLRIVEIVAGSGADEG